MKEHPMLFNTEMVRAILADEKTQTRRVIDQCPKMYDGSKTVARGVPDDAYRFDPPCDDSNMWECSRSKSTTLYYKCPYEVGDRLWVRETWVDCGGYVRYPATDDIHELRKKRPSIHMPRALSRIALEITDVRAERLRYIPEDDARAEGVKPGKCIGCGACSGGDCTSYSEAFIALWDSIYGKRPGQSWEDNPWVWAINFVRI